MGFHFCKRGSSCSSSESSEYGLKEQPRAFGIQREPRQSILFVSWSIVVLFKTPKGNFQIYVGLLRQNSLTCAIQSVRKNDGELLIGDAAIEGEGGGGGISDPAGEISSSLFSYKYSSFFFFFFLLLIGIKKSCCTRSRWRQPTYPVSFSIAVQEQKGWRGGAHSHNNRMEESNPPKTSLRISFVSSFLIVIIIMELL